MKCLKVSLAKTEFLKLIVKYETSFRSSHRRCSILFSKISKFSLEVPVLEFLVNKVAGLKACNFIERRLQHRCFPVHIAKFLRKPILKNVSGTCSATPIYSQTLPGNSQTAGIVHSAYQLWDHAIIVSLLSRASMITKYNF